MLCLLSYFGEVREIGDLCRTEFVFRAENVYRVIVFFKEVIAHVRNDFSLAVQQYHHLVVSGIDRLCAVICMYGADVCGQIAPKLLEKRSLLGACGVVHLLIGEIVYDCFIILYRNDEVSAGKLSRRLAVELELIARLVADKAF